MKEASIDILLPYWGDVGLFKKTVESVIAQTDQDWRMYIFDDAYPTREAEEYIAGLKDSRISYLRHKKNIGITKNFNFALKSAKADYCVILGCDDVLLPNYISVAMANIGDADFYQPGVAIIDAKGAVYMPLADKIKKLLRPRRQGLHGGQSLATRLACGNWLYFPSILWRTSTVQKYEFDSKYDDTQDVIIELSMILDGAKLYLDNEVTFQYRRFADSWSSQRKNVEKGRFYGEAETYRQFALKFKNKGWQWAALAARIHVTSRLHRTLSRLRG